ncbi:uncharacterized protein A1O9_13166 [Exophiala aquamarina CBS 119918]|uniref:Zn(2)-C6 fungal-type domain-containing protein n=1 Tax=Exophiala aquamarina CBS 119918 TaxID=1182545 RepID=A0A072NTU9_9EURO|nr:uncharacterized protein A1O9_13166 [Exophiala aquamarina CBS 119918]KEF50782.1 hypothetical protein A1O9_13166 [Exophiala aquamarina CBS 119918]
MPRVSREIPTPTRVFTACQHCKAKKVRCSGTRPSCDRCTKRRHDCIYLPQTAHARKRTINTSEDEGGEYEDERADEGATLGRERTPGAMETGRPKKRRRDVEVGKLTYIPGGDVVSFSFFGPKQSPRLSDMSFGTVFTESPPCATGFGQNVQLGQNHIPTDLDATLPEGPDPGQNMNRHFGSQEAIPNSLSSGQPATVRQPSSLPTPPYNATEPPPTMAPPSLNDSRTLHPSTTPCAEATPQTPSGGLRTQGSSAPVSHLAVHGNGQYSWTQGYLPNVVDFDNTAQANLSDDIFSYINFENSTQITDISIDDLWAQFSNIANQLQSRGKSTETAKGIMAEELRRTQEMLQTANAKIDGICLQRDTAQAFNQKWQRRETEWKQRQARLQTKIDELEDTAQTANAELQAAETKIQELQKGTENLRTEKAEAVQRADEAEANLEQHRESWGKVLKAIPPNLQATVNASRSTGDSSRDNTGREERTGDPSQDSAGRERPGHK